MPDEKIEEKRKNKPGKVPLFERSKESRSLPIVGSEVPPATYNLKSSIDELINKRVSTRGPYELFSENRSAPITHGPYAQDLDKTLGPGQYPFKSFTDNMNDAAHIKHGKFGKIVQYPTISGDRLSINNTSIRPRNTDPNWYFIIYKLLSLLKRILNIKTKSKARTWFIFACRNSKT